jgi:hypothetical protein
VRDFETYHDFRFVKNQILKPGGHGELYVRWDWKAKQIDTVEVQAEGGPKGDRPLALKARAAAPPYGGYWDPAWRWYASFVLSETAGLERRDEPAYQPGRVRRPRARSEAEVRVVRGPPGRQQRRCPARCTR